VAAAADDSFGAEQLVAACAHDRALTSVSGLISYRFRGLITKVVRFQSDQGDFNES
jgi:hypothetical protein